MFVLTVYVALSAVMRALLYWVVRLAVRHAIEDADRRRQVSQRRWVNCGFAGDEYSDLVIARRAAGPVPGRWGPSEQPEE
ncbi:hypothetical protein [Plantactinospora sp. DSM 117369]